MATSSDIRDRLLADFVNAGKKERAKEEVKSKQVESTHPLITKKIETEGNTTWGELTGIKGYYENFKTHRFEDTDWHEDVRGDIPDELHPFAYQDVFFRGAIALDQMLNVMVWGPPGGGKDIFFQMYCALRRIPYRRITGGDGITPDMAIGSIQLNDKGTYFKEGDAYRICRHGGMLVLSEPAAMARTMFALQSALEKGGHLNVPEHPEPEYRMLPVHKNTWFAMSSNVRGVGDNRGKHSATDRIDSSTINRIDSTLYWPFLPDDLENEVLKSHFPTSTVEFRTKVVKFGKLVKEAVSKGQIKADWSLRTAIPFVRMSLIYGSPAEGLRSTYFDKLDDAEKGAVQSFWKAVKMEGEL